MNPISWLRHALKHEKVEADGRRDLGHFDHHDDEDAKPDQVDARPRRTIGSTTAMVRTTEEIPSRKHAQHDIENQQNHQKLETSSQLPLPAIRSARPRGSPVKPIASERNAAPARIRAIIADVRVAPIRLAVKVDQLSEPWLAARIEPADDAEGGRFGGRRDTQGTWNR